MKAWELTTTPFIFPEIGLGRAAQTRLEKAQLQFIEDNKAATQEYYKVTIRAIVDPRLLIVGDWVCFQRPLRKPRKLWYLRFGLLPDDIAVYPVALPPKRYESSGKCFRPGPWILRPTTIDNSLYKLLACLTSRDASRVDTAWELETSATTEGLSGCVESKAWTLDERRFLYEPPVTGEVVQFVIV
jgi:hypothetical protein